MKQKELMNMAVAVSNKFGGVAPVKSIIAELNGGVAVRIKDLNPSLYDAVAARLDVLLNGKKVAGYAYNSTVAPQGRQPGSYAAFAAPYNKMAEDLKEVKYSPVQEAAPVVPGWISCDERMPDDGVSVLAFCKCGDNFSGIYTMRAPVIRSKNSRKDDSAVNHERVTHWMPLPAAPDAVAETDTSSAQFESLAASPVRTKHAMEGKVDHGGKTMSPFHIGLPGDLNTNSIKLVVDTANLMGQKLKSAQDKYGYEEGWMDPEWPAEEVRKDAFDHLMKGDPLDVMNYMAFMLHHGYSCAPQNREEAARMVNALQEKFDLVDDNAILRGLMYKMEERHGEEFNAFFEATIRQVMTGSGMTKVMISTSGVLQTLAGAPAMRVSEVPGFLVYELVEDNPEATDE